MKIYIIGLSCVGKTRLGKILSSKLKIGNYIDLDLCFNDLEAFGRGEFKFYDQEVAEMKLKKMMRRDKSWLVEGVFPVEKLFEEADKIIMIKYFWMLPVFFQWQRFFSDQWQRQTYGLWSNLKLTPDILRQYFSKKEAANLTDPRVFSVAKYEKMLEKFEKKLIRINSPSEVEKVLKNWQILRKD